MQLEKQASNQERLKVLFLTRWYPNNYDPQLGVFVQKHAIAASQNCKVAVLCILPGTGLRSPFLLEEKESAGPAEFILYYRPMQSGIRMIDRVVNLLFYFLYFHLATRVITRKWGRPDLVHAVVFGRAAVAAGILHWQKGIPFVVSEHWSGYATGQFARRPKLWKGTMRRLAKKASAITAASQFLLGKMQAAGLNGRMRILPNAVEIPGELTRQQTAGEPVKILLVADLEDEIKNVSGVIQAFASVGKDRPGVQLQIIGDGKDRALLEALAQDMNMPEGQIIFYGRKDNATVYEFLLQCSFVVMNSRVETFSLICAEALACGKPVVATRCGGPEEFLSEKTGILIEPGDAAGLENALRKMIDNYAGYDPMKLQDLARPFSMNSTGRALFELYRDLAGTQAEGMRKPGS